MALGINRELKNDAGAKFSAANLAATDNSEDIPLHGMDIIGLSVDLSAATGTLAIALEVTFDGTNYVPFPEDVNSEVQATFDNITSATEVTKYWTNPFCNVKEPDVAGTVLPQARFVMTVTTGPFTFTRCQLFTRSFAQ